MHGIPWPARSNSIVAWLARNDGGTGKEIAEALGQSPQLAGQKLAQLRKAGIVCSRRDPEDRRRQIESLTALGRREFAKLERLEQEATAAFADLFDELGCDVWDVLARMDQALEHESFNDRMARAKPR
ncbi:MarR family winged helix-turn-helix transcriptional regulator [Hyphobacterium marinum]|uniref:MarR family winged helix-turn-helix transcriptional regulator n=1 Tax=Hyphobacterium marinum TaxID=3116574 RepID=A0ABU7M0R8_9PROT|nr:MarR family winged helix-turn-helix transcriptional regulator [Hyphobacterium sp. Y6023]MEE2566995.1 MarR family winged helix-turn-helix transcriptional regulator [Hyphobacterium sp. Y6023]